MATEVELVGGEADWQSSGADAERHNCAVFRSAAIAVACATKMGRFMVVEDEEEGDEAELVERDSCPFSALSFPSSADSPTARMENGLNISQRLESLAMAEAVVASTVAGEACGPESRSQSSPPSQATEVLQSQSPTSAKARYNWLYTIKEGSLAPGSEGTSSSDPFGTSTGSDRTDGSTGTSASEVDGEETELSTNSTPLAELDKPMSIVDAAAVDSSTSLEALSVINHFKIESSDLDIEAKISEGAFSDVLLGSYLGTEVAVKRLKGQIDSSMKSKFRQEVYTLSRLRHPSLLLFMGFSSTENDLLIVSEYMKKGSLWEILRKRERPLDVPEQFNVALSVALGLAYLHQHHPPILHLDLKSANILVDSRWHVKIGDFGLSQTMRKHRLLANAPLGTPAWTAPERLLDENVGPAADVYSFGVVLWELVTGAIPWYGLTPEQTMGKILRGKTLEIPEVYERHPFVSLIHRCWLPCEERPIMKEIVRELRDLCKRGIMRTDTMMRDNGPVLPMVSTVPAIEEEGEHETLMDLCKIAESPLFPRKQNEYTNRW